MSQISRLIKNLETPRPLKSKTDTLHTPHYEIQSIEEMISLVENVAQTLSTGSNDQEGMTILLSNLRTLGPQMELFSKDTLDRSFVAFRNASQDERLNIMTRLNLLELIELRAKTWENSDGTDSYYKHKATNVEPDCVNVGAKSNDFTMLNMSTSGITFGQSTGPLILEPGEILRSSGKFSKPTKIPGKNYLKDEVVIRNADSGKVNPGAKERLVQITGPCEEKIVYAKQLIEDTIRRNASPVRLDAPHGGSCSSLASSASDETLPKNNRHNIGTLLNAIVPSILTGNIGSQKSPRNYNSGGQNMLLHSYSTNDASLGEYKHTVTVGNHNIKITGECLDLVRVAKLVLDDYFSNNEFEAGVCFESQSLNTYKNIQSEEQKSLSFVDSGVSLDLLSNSQNTLVNNSNELDDDVFIVDQVENTNSSAVVEITLGSSSNNTNPTMNSLSRSRRSHFSRKESTPDLPKDKEQPIQRIVHEYQRLLFYSKSPHSNSLPHDWVKISENHPFLVKSKVIRNFNNIVGNLMNNCENVMQNISVSNFACDAV